jgi:hypothetical protein
VIGLSGQLRTGFGSISAPVLALFLSAIKALHSDPEWLLAMAGEPPGFESVAGIGHPILNRYCNAVLLEPLFSGHSLTVDGRE